MGDRPILGELERLAELRDKGILSEEEFQEQKARYLAAPPLAVRTPTDEEQRRNNAFLIELVGGLVGLLGLGYVYAGRTTDGLVRLVGWWIVLATMWTVVATLTAADVPVSRIYSVADMMRDAQFQARQMFEQAALPDGTPMKVPAVVPRLSATPGGTRWLGPRLGEHTDDVLRELGYDADAIRALRDDGVI